MTARVRVSLVVLVVLLLAVPTVLAFAPRLTHERFDGLVVPDPGAVIALHPVPPGSLPAGVAVRTAFEQFVAEQGGGWTGWIDERSGVPTLVTGRGLRWIAAGDAPATPTIDELETLARAFVAQHPDLAGVAPGQLVLDRAASGRIGELAWQVTFAQVVDGVRVRGARYDFHVAAGNLVAFGGTRFAHVTAATTPALDGAAARRILDGFLGPQNVTDLVELEPASLQLVPLDPGEGRGAAWRGPLGAGYEHRLVWHFVLSAPGEAPTWVADVDAHAGRVIAFYDDTRYSGVKGGVFPVSNDGIGPEGTEQPGFPMPFADVNSGAANDAGVFTCSSGTQTTALAGPYIKVSDKCGTISESATCPADIDLGTSPGTDCVVPAGDSAGNTHAARSSFYHLNRVMQKGRTWLPDNSWLKSQVTDNVNITQTCNAYWNGSSVNFFRSGGGCRNTGELQGVFVHEWGHGLDANDGGGVDNPGEAYADIVTLFESHESCVGRGFYMSGNCSGYGDACLSCTGIRDQDWAAHARQTPATPQNFLAVYCGGGDGPCGREGHCEAYVSAETVYDLAARDLPAMGIDPATAWQIAERLWYTSRNGSGGNAYNCALPNADGCGTNTWFHKFLVADDNDGNLSNGTPHAGAIFAAFNRHGIACGSASDPSNQNALGCTPVGKPTLTADPSNGQVRLNWTPAPGAATYHVLRNDIGCSRGQAIIDNTSGTTYLDTAVLNGFTVYYRVQAESSNPACAGAVSDCVAATTPTAAGTVVLDRDAYACSTSIAIRVLDGNTGTSTVTVKLWSNTESTPEIVTLTETTAGSGNFRGSFVTTPAPPQHGDGKLSITSGDSITVEYIDADDGLGGTNLTRRDTALGDCVAPVIRNVHATSITDTSAIIAWDTDESADERVTFGVNRPPAAQVAGGTGLTHHEVLLGELAACSLYYYSVSSTDAAGNAAVDDGGGAFYHFQTLGNFGNGLEVCHQGAVSIGQAAPSCSITLALSVVDVDLDRNPGAVETATVSVTSTSEIEPETVVLTETGTDSLRFDGSLALAPGAPVHDGRLQVKDGDVITVSYFDADDGHGKSAWRTATVRADCRGPHLGPVTVDTLTNARGTVHVTSDEAASAVLLWGTTPALGQVATDAALSTTHAFVLNQFDSCQPVYFRIQGTDASGNTTTADNNGAPFAFRTFRVPGQYWRETFENGTNGWTLGGEWEIGVPQGLGGLSFGFADPLAAYNNGKILGHDLSGKGAHPGDYETGTNEKATSPTLNAGSWKRTKLIIHRQLNAAAGDEASLYLCAGSCTAVYRTGSQPVSDSGFALFGYDVSSLADGKSSVRIEFRQNAPLNSASGWNVDDVIFKDGSLPDFGACGGCGQAPSFTGATSAVDDDACAPGSVTVSWQPAVAWGTGSTGSYAVYRGTAPGFPADAAHRIASGVKARSYVDGSAPAGALYYLVRAENDETCSSGPANGGVTDANAVYVAVNQTASRPVPAPIATLSGAWVNRALVHLSWAPPADASSFNVYRATSPAASAFSLLGTTADVVYEDGGQASDRASYFYVVKGKNACGQEGP